MGCILLYGVFLFARWEVIRDIIRRREGGRRRPTHHEGISIALRMIRDHHHHHHNHHHGHHHHHHEARLKTLSQQQPIPRNLQPEYKGLSRDPTSWNTGSRNKTVWGWRPRRNPTFWLSSADDMARLIELRAYNQRLYLFFIIYHFRMMMIGETTASQKQKTIYNIQGEM